MMKLNELFDLSLKAKLEELEDLSKNIFEVHRLTNVLLE
jgi:hypothetical protein